MVFLAMVLTQPQIITGVTSGLANIFVSQLVPDAPTAPVAEPSTGTDRSKESKKIRKKKDREKADGS